MRPVAIDIDMALHLDTFGQNGAHQQAGRHYRCAAMPGPMAAVVTVPACTTGGWHEAKSVLTGYNASHA